MWHGTPRTPPPPPQGGWGWCTGVPCHRTPPGTLPGYRNGPLGSRGLAGRAVHGNTREYMGIQGNTRDTREHGNTREYGNTRDTREYGNTREYREYREYTGTTGNTGNTGNTRE